MSPIRPDKKRLVHDVCSNNHSIERYLAIVYGKTKTLMQIEEI